MTKATLSPRRTKLEMPGSRLKAEVAKILKEEGYISSFKMGEENRNEARRFTLLIDTLYDEGVNLVVSAGAPPDGLYLMKVEY